jgi:hypothetical protein
MGSKVLDYIHPGKTSSTVFVRIVVENQNFLSLHYFRLFSFFEGSFNFSVPSQFRFSLQNFI